jgi:hypothetical protein
MRAIFSTKMWRSPRGVLHLESNLAEGNRVVGEALDVQEKASSYSRLKNLDTIYKHKHYMR